MTRTQKYKKIKSGSIDRVQWESEQSTM